MRVLLRILDGFGVRLLQGLLAEWRSETDTACGLQRVPQEFSQTSAAELRRSQEQQKVVVRRSLAAWADEQRGLVQGSSFLGWRYMVVGAKHLRRHAECVFLVICQGEMVAAQRISFQAWNDYRITSQQLKQRKLQRQRELQRPRQMRVLVGMADEQGVILLRGMIVEWHSDVERTRRTRRVTALRRSQERQKATVERSVAVWASGQATIVEGSAFVSLRDVVLGVRQLRRHAERVFLVLREGDEC